MEKHCSGEGYKKISNSLIITLSMVKSLRSGRHITPPRLDPDQVAHPNSAPGQAGNWFGMSLNPSMTLKDLQGFMCKMGVNVHQSTTSYFLHKAGLYGQVARKKLLLKKTHLKARMEFAKKHLNNTAGM